MGILTSQGLPGSLSSMNDAGGDEVGVSASQGLLGLLRSTNDAARGDEVGVSEMQGLPGSLRSTNDAAAGSEVGVSASQGLPGDPRVLGCTGYTGIDSGDSGDDTIDEDSCKIKGRSSRGTRISKISGAITRIHSAWMYSKIFAIRASSLEILSTESGPLSTYKMKSQ